VLAVEGSALVCGGCCWLRRLWRLQVVEVAGCGGVCAACWTLCEFCGFCKLQVGGRGLIGR